LRNHVASFEIGSAVQEARMQGRDAAMVVLDRLLSTPTEPDAPNSFAKIALRTFSSNNCPMPANRNAEWVADIEFVFAECLRIRNAVSDAVKNNPASLKDLPREDMWGDLPGPDGKGPLMCGRAANQRLWRLAEQAVKYSDAVGTIEIAPVHKALGRILVERFVTESRDIDEQQAERALSSAVKEAKRARMDRTHYVPCRLMYSKGPTSFAIGPVTFHTREKFNELMAPHFEGFPRREGEDWWKEHDTQLLADARHYYDGFTWVGESRY
jgi:hypothetical protein